MTASRPSCLAAALVPLAAALLRAQPPAARAVAVTGTVYDSLARAPLAGAEVQLLPADGDSAGVGRPFNATTDAAGRYRVDSVPAGRYLTGFLHPRIDSLGIGIAPRTVELRGEAARVDLAFPSAATVQRGLCSPSEISDSTALLVGVVRDAATRQPRRGATVRLRWTELVIGRAGVRQERPEIAVATRGDGWYGVCGVPRSDAGDIGILAVSGADTSGLVPLRLGAGGVVRRDLYVGRSVTAAPATRGGSARLRGTVAAAGGRPVAGARVGLLGAATTATTDDRGGFTLAGQPAGSRLLDVRAVGYVPTQIAVDVLDGGAPNEVAVTLTSAKRYLDTVRVTSRRVFTTDATGFERRRRSSATGRFLTREAIAQRVAFRTSDLLFAVAGVQVAYGRFGQPRVMMRGFAGGLCRPDVYVDGMPLTLGPGADPTSEFETGPDDIDTFTAPDRLDGVEIYRDAATAPPEFHRSTSNCGSIVLWTRLRDERPRRLAAPE